MHISRSHIKSRPADCDRGCRDNPVRRISPGTLLLLLAMLYSAAATADELAFSSGSKQVTLLELYTSQGCSSCPPAERWLNKYVDYAGLWTQIIPLAFHVDYWDYIGWKDVYASPENGERQRDYARAGKARSVYTPGLFSNGREWRGWILRVHPRASSRKPGNLTVVVDSSRITATFEAAGEPTELHLALLGFDISTQVDRGENRNTTLQQQFVVLAHASYVSANGRWAVPIPQGESTAARYALAAWVSTPDNPVPVQATGGWLTAGLHGRIGEAQLFVY